jgi:hypothetical protein
MPGFFRRSDRSVTKFDALAGYRNVRYPKQNSLNKATGKFELSDAKKPNRPLQSKAITKKIEKEPSANPVPELSGLESLATG